ncbi:hypothetical protein [Desulfitobacterium sp.]|uniref:hypothetical protein n=1 Tax=Desulfitobacterium sp. TaxID=49981 RepID=UPI002B1F6A35|nr:hypothetical protein [Desulfitobacterium sp.]MEA4900001.1 hypothetical protein [Desulfitobacterium sp.]
MRSLKGGLRIAGVIMIGVLLLIGTVSWNSPGKAQAAAQANRFAKAVNDNNPADLYDYLLPEIQNQLSREEFVQNFAHERSYPYLTPLYIYLDEVDLAKGQKSGEAIFTVASRLPGEKMKVKLAYVEGKYYIDAFRDVADGSYIEKFKKL